MTGSRTLYLREDTATGVSFRAVLPRAKREPLNEGQQVVGMPRLHPSELAHPAPLRDFAKIYGFLLTPPPVTRPDVTQVLTQRFLGLAQMRAAYCHTLLSLEIYRRGCGFANGDAERDPRVHGKYGEIRGYSAAYSLHKLRLARDFHLFRVVDGKRRYVTTTAGHKPFGDFWMALGEVFGWPLEWGGSGDRKDGNHYSYGFDGRW